MNREKIEKLKKRVPEKSDRGRPIGSMIDSRRYAYGFNDAIEAVLALGNDGMVCVPIEPTEEMVLAGVKYRDGAKDTSCRFIYKAMISAHEKDQKGE